MADIYYSQEKEENCAEDILGNNHSCRHVHRVGSTLFPSFNNGMNHDFFSNYVPLGQPTNTGRPTAGTSSHSSPRCKPGSPPRQPERMPTAQDAVENIKHAIEKKAQEAKVV
ncbi:hypothetical protein BD779DRAFT_1493938 [Infundibulicybe gibba]|nr:hypothetical protein BD779DRAFT_1493938 [Infundibulicybe gibba]